MDKNQNFTDNFNWSSMPPPDVATSHGNHRRVPGTVSCEDISSNNIRNRNHRHQQSNAHHILNNRPNSDGFQIVDPRRDGESDRYGRRGDVEGCGDGRVVRQSYRTPYSDMISEWRSELVQAAAATNMHPAASGAAMVHLQQHNGYRSGDHHGYRGGIGDRQRILTQYTTSGRVVSLMVSIDKSDWFNLSPEYTKV